MKPLFVGEANPYADEARRQTTHFALYPLPERSAGGRLAAMLRLKPLEYLRSTHRVNLFHMPPRRWDAAYARLAAANILSTYPDASVVIMLGARVAAAFGHPKLAVWDYAEHKWVAGGRTVRLYRVPHPSGRCRAWSDPRSARLLRNIVRRYMPTEAVT